MTMRLTAGIYCHHNNSTMTLLQRAILFLWLGVAIIQPSNAQPQCERLKNTLTYTQQDAPRDLTKVVRCCRLKDGVIVVSCCCVIASYAFYVVGCRKALYGCITNFLY